MIINQLGMIVIYILFKHTILIFINNLNSYATQYLILGLNTAINQQHCIKEILKQTVYSCFLVIEFDKSKINYTFELLTYWICITIRLASSNTCYTCTYNVHIKWCLCIIYFLGTRHKNALSVKQQWEFQANYAFFFTCRIFYKSNMNINDPYKFQQVRHECHVSQWVRFPLLPILEKKIKFLV